MKLLDKEGNRKIRCAVYTRKSSEEGLEQSFNSLHAQREACEAYIKSQRHEGWALTPSAYDDGGFSGGNMERPALTRLIEDIKHGTVDLIVVYKVDRLSRSLADFVRLVELFDNHGVSFVSVTQQFNTSTSMGRLTLNVLLSFAQFEREVTGERIRDKIAASKRKGMWMGGPVPLGYDAQDKLLVVNKEEAETVRYIYTRYLELGCVRKLKADLDSTGHVSKIRKSAGGMPFSRGALYTLLKNPIYVGKIAHKGATHDGQHAAVLETTLWEQVQQQLSENKVRRNTRTNARGASLLAGLIYDDKGNPMSPTHATKQNRRYRYYISQAVLQYREADEGSVIRIPAQAIERTVTDEIKRLLGSSQELLKMVIFGDLPANKQKTTIRKAKSMADTWDERPYPDQINLLKKIIQRVTVGQQEICILFSRDALASILLIDIPTMNRQTDSSTEGYQVNIPAALKRCGIETKLIISGKDVPQAHPNSVKAIQDALAKALVWNQALVTGRAVSMTVLAKEEGVTQRYIAHLIKLAFLAPDIMESVIKGDLPASLSLGSLKKGIPLDWQKQRDLFGFA